MKPFSVVEAKAFIRMLKSATLGQYNEISAHTLSCRAIPKIYKFMKKTIIDLLNAEKDGLEGIALTSDIWSARTKHPYVSLTGHYQDKNFRLRRFFFAMKYFPEDYTANNISVKIKDMFHEIELNPKTVRWITIVIDSAANIQKGDPRLDRFDLVGNTHVNTLKELVDRDPTLQPIPPETSSQNKGTWTFWMPTV